MIVNAATSYFLGPIKLLVKLALAVVALIVAGFIYLAVTVDLNDYKAQIEAQASKAMGRPVHVTGDLDWGMSWFKPSVELNGVVIGSLKNPEAQMDKLSLVVALWDLLGGEISGGKLPASVNIAIDTLSYDGQVIGDIQAPVSFTDKGLSIDTLAVSFPHDGDLEAQINYQDSQLTVVATAKDIDYALLIPGASGGDLEGRLELTGRGVTIDAVLAGLKGHVTLVGGKGRLSGDALRLWANDVLSNVLTGSKDHTNVTCLLLNGQIAGGVFTPAQAILDTEQVLVKATGRIDLSRQRLHLLLSPRPKDSALISLATPLRVEGAWNNPSVRPDQRAVLEKFGGLVLGIVVPPTALLTLTHRGDRSSPCVAALK